MVCTICLFFFTVFQKDFFLLAQPVITNQPTSVTTCSNTASGFCVTTSTGGTTFQWKMSAAGTGPFVNCVSGTPAGATYGNTTSSCMDVTFSNLGTYYYQCVLTSGGSTTTNTVSFTVVAGSNCGTGAKTYGSNAGAGWYDWGSCIVEASDGNGVVMTGETAFDPTGLTDACIFKINTQMNGSFVWGRDLGSNSGGNEDLFSAVIKNSAGNYVVTGQVMDAANSLQVYLAEFPKAGGAPTWTRKLGKSNYEWGNAIIQHSNGDYYIAGYSAEDGGGGVFSGQLYSGRFQVGTGNKVWTRHIGYGVAIGTTPDEAAYGIVETGSGTTAGDIILVGNTTKVPSTLNEEIAIVRQNANGGLLSARYLAPAAGTGNEVATCIKRVSTGGYIICGYTNSSGAGGYDFYVAKLNDDATLSVAWQKTVGRAGQDDYGQCVVETSDGGFVIAGYTENTGTFADDAYVVKLSSTGALVWTRIMDFGGVDDVLYSIIEMSDLTLAACGFTKANPDSDILFVGLNSDGTITASCTNSTGGTLNTPTFAYSTPGSTNNADALGTSGTETTNNVTLSSWPKASLCGVIVLPVELRDFSVKCEGKSRIISWETAVEQENNLFTIQHSKDGEKWEDVVKVKGAGTSYLNHNYKEKFKEKSGEYKYYRLKQTDLNGSENTFEIVSVNCISTNDIVTSVYPNPATNEVSIDVESSIIGELQIQLLDITGRIVLDEVRVATEDNHELKISLSKITNGIYYLKTSADESGYSYTTKLIKN